MLNKEKKEFKEKEATESKGVIAGENQLQEKLLEYDREMEEKTDQLEKVTDNYNKVAEELQIVKDLYSGIMEERRRKDEEERKI